ncbi:MAG: Rieske 2Fe-2S domain-containing protein, partial [Gemmatimonadaceae bacterium]
MSDQAVTLRGPDLTRGVPVGSLGEGELVLGHVDGQQAIMVRRGDHIFAVGAVCSHYGGPLSEGIVVDETVRCPWHHACFSLKTGEAVRAPALHPLPRWEVEQRDGKAYVTHELTPPSIPAPEAEHAGVEPRSVVIIGGGAAGSAAAVTLRRAGFAGGITMLSADKDAPYDRPNISKDYLAG